MSGSVASDAVQVPRGLRKNVRQPNVNKKARWRMLTIFLFECALASELCLLHKWGFATAVPEVGWTQFWDSEQFQNPYCTRTVWFFQIIYSS